MHSPAAGGRLDAVRHAIDRACQRSGRDPSGITFLAVTKLRSREELEEVYALGLRNFGENRVGEAVLKQSLLPSDIDWHMIGHLQSKKAKDCLGFSWLHSLDRIETARALEKAFASAGKTLNVLLEVNTGGEDSKDGVRSLDELKKLVETVITFKSLRVRGLMTMAPFTRNESVVRPCFVQLREWKGILSQEFPELPWDTLSMGMTNDFEWAIEEGSTIVRIGTALFEGFRE